MATKNKKTKKTSRLAAFLQGNKLRYALVVALVVFGSYLLIAFCSFLFTGAFDQSKLDVPTDQLLKNPTLGVKNDAGQTGATLGYYFMNRGFGLASFLFIYIIIVTVFKLLRSSYFRFWKNICLSFLAILWLSTMLGLLVSSPNDGFHVAGITGLYFAHVMTAKFGFVGSLLLLFGALIITLVLVFDQFVPWVGQMKRKWFDERLFASSKPKENSEELEEDDFDEEDEIYDEEDEEFSTYEKDEEDEERVDIKNLAIDGSKELDMEEGDEEDDDLEEDDDYSTHEINGKNSTLGITIKKKAEEEELLDHNVSVGNLDEDYDPTLDLSNYKFPTIDLLDDHQGVKHDVSEEELIENKNKIVETLSHYKIEIVKIHATIGPTITLYEIVPAPGTRVNKIKNLEDDIALSLAALGVRIIAPIPGKGTIGIEVPNKKPEIVSMRSIVASKKFQESKADLPVVMGKTITNETFVFDLAKMPHLLVAGATGQGKSVGLNAIITSLLYKKHPSQLKMVMVDPKMVELNIYGVIEKHFLAQLPDADKPIITEVDKVKSTLNSLTIEMDERYKLLMKANTRNIKEYNAKFIARRLNPLNGHKYLPYIVMVVDEFADLIMTAGKEIEMPIARIAQKARAVGMHMIIATQRPSTNIITGVIKANFPGRIAFRVASMIDSRTILDFPGANQLIGKGDMLFMQGSDMTRLQCAFVDTPEVERVCDFIAKQQGYPTAFMLPEYVPEGEGSELDVDLNQRDELFEEVARMVVANQMGSTSMIQRKFSIGYNRAGRIMDQLEVAGVVGSSEGSKPRQVLIQDDYALEQLMNNL